MLDPRKSITKMGLRRNSHISWWLLVIGAVLATVLLAPTGHAAVIKRENSISAQELVAEELLAAANQTDKRTKDNEAVSNANRITDAGKKGFEMIQTDDEEEEVSVTGEPLNASATDTPIPTFQPSIDRYTSAYRDDGVADSESLRESEGGVFTTVDYEQRFDRIEMTTEVASTDITPTEIFQQDAVRFDVHGMKDSSREELEKNSNGEEQATIVNLDASNKDNSTSELENTKYETQTDISKINDTTNGGQKRGKFLQNPEEATIINSEINDSNLSIPSTADVWALAAMKNVEPSIKKAGPIRNEPVERIPTQDSVNGTSSTKLLTDWMEIMKNNEFSNGSFLRNEIPSVGERPVADAPEFERVENKVVEVMVTPPAELSSTNSIRRFDEAFDATTTEQNIDRSIDLNYPTGIGSSGVSDNLYYEDFTTDLPDILTTTPATKVEPTALFAMEDSNQQQPVMTLTTESVPRNEINTVPNEASYDRKPVEVAAINDNAGPLESTSMSENIIPITTEAENRGSLQNPTTPGDIVVTTEESPRVIPLVDAVVTTEKKELEQQREEEVVVGEDKEQNSQIVQSTVNPTDITNNSIEKQTETKVVESNNLPEYTVVEPTAAGGVGKGDAITNNNSNYLETINSHNRNSSSPSDDDGSQSNATLGHEDAQHGQQLAHEQLYHPTTESTGVVPVTEPSNVEGESGAAVSASEAMTTTATSTTQFQATSAVVPQRTISVSPSTTGHTTTTVETMESETKPTTMSSEQIKVEQRRTNGHQVIDPTNNTLELGAIGDTVTTPEDGSDVNAIIAITVSVIAVVALVLLVGFLYVMRKRQKQLSYGQRCQPVGLDAYSLDNVSVYNSVRRKNNNLRLSKRSYGNSAFEDPGLKFNNLSIQGLQTIMNTKSEIYEEFKEIPQITARVDEVPSGCEDKNRYANVVPLPETRVHLKQLNGDEKTEYINANYVRGPKDNTNYYIACQAPMENTIVDFWRMIWEQNSKVICMLTDLTENGIEKCAEYLPPSAVLDTNRVFGDYGVTMKNREVKDKYAVSTIHLRNSQTNTWREITHFWYEWPEQGMPLDETSIIAMLLEVRSYLKMAMPDQVGSSEDDAAPQEEKQKKIQELNDELTEKLEEDGGEKKSNGTIDKSKSLQRSQGPLTVHCSPGTGRTGTIIACDIALRSLEMKNRSVDVPQTVYYVRRGRASTIKTRDQYEFIYRCAHTYAQKLIEPIAEN